MATELGVTHEAVGSWETGARAVPGPVIKLMEPYEEELGMSDTDNDATHCPPDFSGRRLAELAPASVL
jgi:hypothetical protein